MDFNSEFDPQGSSRPFKHPVVTFFHLLFRSAAIFVYLFGSFFSSSFIGIFVSVVLLLSLDFWTVKNITGRIMVGLRWWNYIDDEGKSQWVFEARNGDSAHLLSAAERHIFWAALVLAPALWAVFFLTALFGFKFQWMVLVIIGLSFSLSNLLGYMRCRLGHSGNEGAGGVADSVKNLANTYMRQQMMANVMGMFGGGGGARGGGANASAAGSGGGDANSQSGFGNVI